MVLMTHLIDAVSLILLVSCGCFQFVAVRTCPRSALPEPQTETKVVDAVHIRLAQMEMVTKRCKHAWTHEAGGVWGVVQRCISTGRRAFWA